MTALATATLISCMHASMVPKESGQLLCMTLPKARTTSNVTWRVPGQLESPVKIVRHARQWQPLSSKLKMMRVRAIGYAKPVLLPLTVTRKVEAVHVCIRMNMNSALSMP